MLRAQKQPFAIIEEAGLRKSGTARSPSPRPSLSAPSPVSSRSDDLGTHIGHKPRLGSSERSACATGGCVFLCVSLHNCALLAYGRYF